MSDDLIGKNIGAYEILDRVDQGGMATVYRARQTSMNRVVALKVLPQHFMRDDTYLRRFEREVEIIARLEHRNIVPVYDYGQHEGQPYIVMRYMPSGSISDLLRHGPIELDRILEIIEQVAPALDFAHTKNILHRDLKPSNILLDDNGDAYITDFGIARIIGVENQSDTITTQGVVGTPSYMSPEQAQGKDLDGRSDVYSLGIMLFEMLTGRRPFENDTPYGIAVMQVTTAPPNPRSINPDVSAAVEQVVLKALKKKPNNRYNTANELAQALRMAIERPDSVHDTEPSGIPIRRAHETQPNPVSQALQQAQPQQHPQAQIVPPVASTPPPYTPMPMYSTPPQSQQMRRTSLRARIQGQRNQPGNVVVMVLLGMTIGCALLSILVVAVLISLESLFQSAETTTTNLGGPTLDATSEAARQALIPGSGFGDDPDSTPVFSNATPIPTRTPTSSAESEIAPIGQRATATVDPVFAETLGRIVYFADRDGNYDIFQYDLLTSTETLLVGGAFTASYPQISPDGRQMVYQSNEDGDFEIYVMDLSSGERDKLTDNAVLDRLPAWSPDGEWIIFSSDTRDDGTLDLMRIRPDGSDLQTVLSNGQRNSHARFSPDGQFIVFTTGSASDSSTWDVALFNLTEGSVRMLIENDVRESSPIFSPDGARILFITDGAGGGAIAEIALDSPENINILYDGGGYEWGIHYDPAGEFIVFNEESGGNVKLMIMRVDGSDQRQVNNQGGYYPSWVP